IGQGQGHGQGQGIMDSVSEADSAAADVDRWIDYFPLYSSVTNACAICVKAALDINDLLSDLFRKYVLNAPPLGPSKSHFLQYIRDKSYWRCLTLLVPILGNILVALYDCNRTSDGNYSLFERMNRFPFYRYALYGTGSLERLGFYLLQVVREKT